MKAHTDKIEHSASPSLSARPLSSHLLGILEKEPSSPLMTGLLTASVPKCLSAARTTLADAPWSVQDSLDNVEGFDARVIQCLQDLKDELQQPQCKEEVHTLGKRASQDIRFDEPLADACYEDRARLCEGVQPVSRFLLLSRSARYSLTPTVACQLFVENVIPAPYWSFRPCRAVLCGTQDSGTETARHCFAGFSESHPMPTGVS